MIRRLVTLISTQAQLTAEGEASKKQAESATDVAKKLMEEKENAANLVSPVHRDQSNFTTCHLWTPDVYSLPPLSGSTQENAGAILAGSEVVFCVFPRISGYFSSL